MRLLAVTTLVTTFGSGLFYTTSALFFTRIVGLSVAQVGVGLTIAGLCGVLAGMPFGHLADRRGARRLLVVLLVLEGLATLAFVAVDSFAAFVLVASAAAVCDRGGSTVRNALIALAVPEGERVRGRALLRSLTNVGIGCGTAVAALALHFDSRPAYVTLIVADTCAFMIAAALLTRLPRATADARAPGAGAAPRLLALRDRPYLAVTVLFGLVSFQFGIFELGLPIWVAEHTSAPRTVVAAALLVNTALIVCLQVRASRGTEEAPGAARACAWAGLLLGGACVLYAAAAELPAAGAVGLLLIAVVVQTGGELLSSAGGWGLSYALARPEAPGQYQGVFNSGFGAAIMLSPLVVTLLPLTLGWWGWIALGALFAVSGAALVPVTRWAERSRATVPA
jgi:MFS family permease